MTGYERRGAPRVRFTSRIVITSRDKRIRATTDARNISLKGMYVQSEQFLPVGTPCLMDIELSSSSSKVNFTVAGRICRHDARGMGIAFGELDVDSFIHIKNLVLLNSMIAET